MTRGLRNAFLVMALGFTPFILGPTPAQAVTLQIDLSGKLTGATGVNVFGRLYDVQFLDGTCSALFNGCDAISDFTFQDSGSALQASSELLDQVFRNHPTLGRFDSDPSLTNGCGLFVCLTRTPFAPLLNVVQTWVAINNTSGFGGVGFDSDTVEQRNFLPNADTTSDPAYTWAQWSLTPVPAPDTLMLFGLGLGTLVLWNYQRRRAGARVG